MVCCICDRTVTMTFDEGQSVLHSSVAVLDEDLHNDDEVFYVQLINPKGGAAIGKDWQVLVTILGNVNPYGIIEFSPVRGIVLYIVLYIDIYFSLLHCMRKIFLSEIVFAIVPCNHLTKLLHFWHQIGTGNSKNNSAHFNSL